jgi:hypothetical protein
MFTTLQWEAEEADIRLLRETDCNLGVSEQASQLQRLKVKTSSFNADLIMNKVVLKKVCFI